MGEWGLLSGLFDTLQMHSPMLGRFWLLIMLVFRILILGTVASDLFQDEQQEFACNTLQPGCKQVCYDMAFPISQYRFWVFHIVLIATPSLVFLMYAMHQHKKREESKFRRRQSREDLRLKRFYIINVAFRVVAEVGFLSGQWLLYGFKVEAQFPCSRFPCPYTVDCFTSRPAEKTIFLCFYFIIGAIAAFSSCIELFYHSIKWFCGSWHPIPEHLQHSQALHNIKQDEEGQEKGAILAENAPSTVRLKGGSMRSNSKASSLGHKQRGGKYVSSKMFMV
ncbi:gap junction delta-3 protein [Cynoglossus semilaevis]|uniref:gap junction delta-3 protein n=1 Tax=Cynoglossus semilaevis TaxID=244447 RepID=UPI000496433E|nr:gap junction delta-3 protein [Cynoglossus semilaevis]